MMIKTTNKKKKIWVCRCGIILSRYTQSCNHKPWDKK